MFYTDWYPTSRNGFFLIAQRHDVLCRYKNASWNSADGTSAILRKRRQKSVGACVSTKQESALPGEEGQERRRRRRGRSLALVAGQTPSSSAVRTPTSSRYRIEDGDKCDPSRSRPPFFFSLAAVAAAVRQV